MGRARFVCHAAALIALSFAQPIVAAEKLSKKEIAAIAMTPEQIAEIADVQNDPLDMFVRIDTEPFLKVDSGDKFVRAFIHKKTGEVKFQIYLWAQYSGDWQFFDRVNYAAPDGPIAVDARKIGQEVLGCNRFGCLKREDIAFEVPEDFLRTVAAEATPGADNQWNFRVYGRFEGGITTGILKTEIAGALLAVDREKALLQK